MSATAVPASRGRTVGRTALALLGAAVLLLVLVAGVGLLLTHVLTHSAVTAEDSRIDNTLAAHRTPTWTHVTHLVTNMAETPTIVIATAVAALLAALIWRHWREPLYLVLTVAGETAIFVTVTLLVHRHRPTVPHLDPAPPTSSFPSGHTAASVAFYGGLAALVWHRVRNGGLRGLFLLAGVLVPVAVALCRLYRGMHYPTDVVMGGVLGLSWLSVTTRLVLRGRPAGRTDHPGSTPSRAVVAPAEAR